MTATMTINIWHLAWIVPATAVVFFVVGAILKGGMIGREDRKADQAAMKDFYSGQLGVPWKMTECDEAPEAGCPGGHQPTQTGDSAEPPTAADCIDVCACCDVQAEFATVTISGWDNQLVMIPEESYRRLKACQDEAVIIAGNLKLDLGGEQYPAMRVMAVMALLLGKTQIELADLKQALAPVEEADDEENGETANGTATALATEDIRHGGSSTTDGEDGEADDRANNYLAGNWEAGR